MKTKDQYQFFLDKGPLKNLNSYFKYDHLDTKVAHTEQVDDFFGKKS